MIVDDRLDTVLRTHAAGKMAARTQLRQLVDLVGAVPLSAWSARHASALERIDSLAETLSDDECAAVLRGTMHRSAVLVYHFAQGSPRTASAIIASARLPEDDWIALIPRLPVTARGLLRHRTDLGERVREVLAQLGVNDFLLPEPDTDSATQSVRPLPAALEADRAEEEPPVQEAANSSGSTQAPETTNAEGIGAIVRRIEAFRRKREKREAAAPLPRTDGVAPLLPFGDVHTPSRKPPLYVDVRTDAEGVVVHAGVDPAGMLVGSRLFTANTSAPVHCSGPMADAFRKRLPVVAGSLSISGADHVAGRWQVDGTPRFSSDSNSFNGYLLRLRRPLAVAPATQPAPQITSADEADRLRQLLHELRTPINAIQGFAEVIQQQVFGQTPHQYRAIAASIASDAAQMLAGFEEVERLVKLESRTLTIEDGKADATAVVGRMIEQVRPVLSARNVRFDITLPAEPVHVAFAPDEVEQSVWRVLSVIASSVAPGEHLAVMLEAQKDLATVTLTLPASLGRLDDAALFAPAATASVGSFAVAAMLGNGFTLRLARAELEAGGGALRRDHGHLLIGLPYYTGDCSTHPLPALADGGATADRQSFAG
jgi:two-component system, OmpR family, sensor kinase